MRIYPLTVSKPFFDAALMVVVNHEKHNIQTAQFRNKAFGRKAFKKRLKKHHVSFNENTLLVIENTGICHRLIWAFCNNKNLPIYIGNAAYKMEFWYSPWQE